MDAAVAAFDAGPRSDEDAARTIPDADACLALCSRAKTCLTELIGTPGAAAECMTWCTNEVAADKVSACASCFQAESCSDIFRDPTHPWELKNLNPGHCIEECGLGTCELDSECAAAQLCGFSDGKVACQ